MSLSVARSSSREPRRVRALAPRNLASQRISAGLADDGPIDSVAAVIAAIFANVSTTMALPSGHGIIQRAAANVTGAMGVGEFQGKAGRPASTRDHRDRMLHRSAPPAD